MEKQSCQPGYKPDPLVKECIPYVVMETPEQPVSDSLSVLNPGASAGPWPPLNPAAWVCVGLGVCSVLLALLLWFFIYKRHGHGTGSRHSGSPARSKCKGTSRMLPLLGPKADPPASCPHSNGRIHEISVCDTDKGWDMCTGRAEHSIPLPATELGDSALVTTKTVQPAEA